MHALLDCNSFYASCERLFRPDLCGRPVAVLSNNDGCVIALSSEAKELGIKVGTPYFECRAKLRRANGCVFSSNFALYGDISSRVMDCLRERLGEIRVYSIDEAFFEVSGSEAGRMLPDVCATVRRWCGIPVSVGAGETRTLAKVANRLAKRRLAGAGGSCVIGEGVGREEALRLTPVGDVWGIGRRLSKRLAARGMESALDFSRLPPDEVRSEMGLPAMLTVKELNGEPCIGLRGPAWRKSIIHSRSFPGRTGDAGTLVSVTRSFAARAAERARKLGLRAGMVGVYLTTGRHGSGERHTESRAVPVAPPSSDSWELMALAESLVRAMHRPGCAYVKSGVTLLELTGQGQGELEIDRGRPGRGRLLEAVDRLNRRYGREAVRFGGLRWRQNRNLLSPSYVSCRDDLPQVS